MTTPLAVEIHTLPRRHTFLKLYSEYGQGKLFQTLSCARMCISNALSLPKQALYQRAIIFFLHSWLIPRVNHILLEEDFPVAR